MKLHCLEGRTPSGYTTFGACWDKGEVTENAFTLQSPDGADVPVQSKAQAFWPDGSIKWSAHTACAEKIRDGAELLPAPAAPAEGIRITKREDSCTIDTGVMTLTVPLGENLYEQSLAKNICLAGRPAVQDIYPVFVLEYREDAEGSFCTTDREDCGLIRSAVLEEEGPLQAVVRFTGSYVTDGSCNMPFVIRLYVWKDSAKYKFVHTFLYDGHESDDYLKGMGLRFCIPLTGAAYHHHVQYLEEDKVFHETAMLLHSRFPRVWYDVEEQQMSGALAHTPPSEAVQEAADNLPVWQEYYLVQDSAAHYAIRKRTKTHCCWLNARQGYRAGGVMAVTGEDGGLVLGIRDFWQKYPGGLSVDRFGSRDCACTAWFYSPAAEAYDFRHYDTESYPMTCYEGFEEVGASARGIGVTSECHAELTGALPDEAALRAFAAALHKPAVFVGTPEYYHQKKAFGPWSLPKTDTAAGRKIEKQLALAFGFYQREIESRGWYGLFDYGDVMHSYDPVRHCWNYDVGGFAWQNTELVPTYWLWVYFLRTGREDVFTLAEAMSRHTSEVDVYHFGPLQGLGSRHNVRHWGCSCKEPRIGMAGHHRFLFYLTGDARIGDVMNDVKDADLAMSRNPHSMCTMPDGSRIPGARSGPDWSSYVSNWMTYYERTLDETYRRKIEIGIRDIAASPYGFASGPDYGYDPATAHLIYHGEIEDTPNQHLQICMGGPQVWLETADMLEDDTLCVLLEKLGAFYYLPREEKVRLTNGQIDRRPFSNIELVTCVTGYSAGRSGDAALARKTWDVQMDALYRFTTEKGFVPESYVPGVPVGKYQEIAGISTNSTAQWCLNTILCLEFIPDALPEDRLESLPE